MMTRFFGMILLVLCLLPGFTSAQVEEPPTLRIPGTISQPQYFDPVLANTKVDVYYTVNLFVSLLRTSPTQYAAIEPSLATRWEVSDDGLTYTFYLREDVPWVQYDPATDEIIPLRMVDAHDVVYGIQRMCSDWRNGRYAVDIFGPVIAGCENALDGGSVEQVGVKALDDFTVEITLTEPGDYFRSLATLWTISPVPHEAIEAHGDEWMEIGNMITSGPFVLVEATSDRIVLRRNPYLPNGISGDGNVEQVIVTDPAAPFAAFQAGELERSPIPARRQSGYTGEFVRFESTLISFVGISNDKPPMDDVQVRRAFAAAISHEDFIDTFYSGNGQPIYHFAAENLFGGIPGTEIGVGYDLEYARQQLAAAGYPDCEGLPTIELMVSESLAVFLTEQFAALGCTAEQFVLRDQADMVMVVDPSLFTPAEYRPHLWDYGYFPDYADVDIYMQLVSCGVNNYFRRECTDVDSQIIAARQSFDRAERIKLYREIQEALFGENGEFPLIPLANIYQVRAIQPWFKGPHDTNGIVGGERYDFYSIGDAPPYVAQVPVFAESEIAADITPTATPEAATATPTPGNFQNNGSGNGGGAAQTATITTPESTPTPAPTEVTPEAATSAETCTIRSIMDVPVYTRKGPGVEFVRTGFLEEVVEHRVIGQAQDIQAMTWWQLESGSWVREDVVGETGNCEAVPVVES